MPERPLVAGAPCWVDLSSSDPDRARTFYGELFGWSAEPSVPRNGSGHLTFSSNGAPVCGCTRSDPGADTTDTWTVYLSSDDAGATVASAAACGGRVLLSVVEVPGQGSMAVVADPGGAIVGVWQPAGHTGFATVNEPGTPNWFELDTGGYEAAVTFYERVFGWATEVMSDTADYRYTTLGEGQAAVAGIFDATAYLPEGAPASWVSYWGVENLEPLVVRAQELGGAVVQPTFDTPFGRIAMLADPMGAVFKVLERPTIPA